MVIHFTGHFPVVINQLEEDNGHAVDAVSKSKGNAYKLQPLSLSSFSFLASWFVCFLIMKHAKRRRGEREIEGGIGVPICQSFAESAKKSRQKLVPNKKKKKSKRVKGQKD